MNINDLNNTFGVKNQLTFTEGANGIVIADLSSSFSTCKISLYGAHVLSFIPEGGADLLMVSEKSFFGKGQPIRGGIPVCFPWFGVHSSNSELPNHGFARLLNWEVIASNKCNDGAISLKLGLSSNEKTFELWPFTFYTELEVIVGKQLELKWVIKNNGDSAFDISHALHSYFAVKDVADIRVEGLEGTSFIDSTKGGELKNGEGFPVIINMEVNRIYLDTNSECKVVDKKQNTTIRIKKTGSNSTIVWNPWAENCKKISDFGDDEYKQFVCVESGNVKKNSLMLKPGQLHLTTLMIYQE